jgi:hypothetical protein
MRMLGKVLKEESDSTREGWWECHGVEKMEMEK